MDWSWVWFFVIVFMIWIILNKSSKITELKSKVKALEVSFKELKTENHELFIRLDQQPPRTSSPKPKRVSGVGYEEAIYLQERKIESKYFQPKPDVDDDSNFFFGKKVVITGLFDSFEDRNELAELFWLAGADIDTTIGPNTEYLIVGNDYGPSKMSKAIKQKIDIIDQDRLPDYFDIE